MKVCKLCFKRPKVSRLLVLLCRKQAEGVKDQTKSTKQELNVSEKAIKKAMDALKKAHGNLNSTRNATAQVDATESDFCSP